ncbi:hypothetical protein Pyrde_1246 [Pyrodictium delaneyi]|uniref:Uncharacterized protein n=1 Tax=Pyrodictium delaneyi TaxID=1273541 RepID=A0A0P0N4D2_9CREN|nr:hypothetical protein [Pyrodictium delaneyi]ALL01294.1 hypothetical protein Pyrde_1246 [Pyrodictium delaneyi]OWJ55639.1 hypothetical protein Pdsh_02295 [Pyrodictium delaneyi]
MRAQLQASEETCSLAVRFLDPLPEAARRALEKGGLARLRLRGKCFSGVLYLAGRLEGDVLAAEVFPVGGECRLGASTSCTVEVEELRAVGLEELWRGTRGLIPPAVDTLELLAEAGAAAAAYAGLSTWPACDEPMLWEARVDGDCLEVEGPLLCTPYLRAVLEKRGDEEASREEDEWVTIAQGVELRVCRDGVIRIR